MNVVFDASVAAKWIFSEEGSKRSTELLIKSNHIYEPDYFFIEIESIITKKVHRKEITMDFALARKSEIYLFGCRVTEYKTISKLAFDLSTTLPITLYDATYVATAMRKDALFYTADQRLVRGLSTTKLSQFVKSIYE